MHPPATPQKDWEGSRAGSVLEENPVWFWEMFPWCSEAVQRLSYSQKSRFKSTDTPKVVVTRLKDLGGSVTPHTPSQSLWKAAALMAQISGEHFPSQILFP